MGDYPQVADGTTAPLPLSEVIGSPILDRAAVSALSAAADSPDLGIGGAGFTVLQGADPYRLQDPARLRAMQGFGSTTWVPTRASGISIQRGSPGLPAAGQLIAEEPGLVGENARQAWTARQPESVAAAIIYPDSIRADMSTDGLFGISKLQSWPWSRAMEPGHEAGP